MVRAHVRTLRRRTFMPPGEDPERRDRRIDIRSPDAPAGVAIPRIPAGPALSAAPSRGPQPARRDRPGVRRLAGSARPGHPGVAVPALGPVRAAFPPYRAAL